MSLDHAKTLQILQPNGILHRSLKGFETREQQQKMMLDVITAYNRNAIALVEAGTGTGKSMAYLIPALLWALQKKERTVISTNTITLQEQLINKDIPLLLKTLNIDLKVVLVKGMGNYLCLRKLEEAKSEILFFNQREAQEIQKIDVWSQTSNEGTRSTLPFIPSGGVWEKVCAESDTCNNNECPYYQSCHFFKARREANEAQILVANHHLLFADLASRANNGNYHDTAILPLYRKVILDEAHHIEDIATEYLAGRLNQLEILRVLGRLSAEKGSNEQGKLPLLKEKILGHYRATVPPKETHVIFNCLNLDLPGIRRDVIQQVTETFETLGQFLATFQKKNEETGGEMKQRLLTPHFSHPFWINEVIPKVQGLIAVLTKYVQVLTTLENEIKFLENEKLNEQTKGIRFEITALGNRLLDATVLLQEFIVSKEDTARVRWIETQTLKTMTNIHLVNAKLDISKPLVDFLFSKFPSIILCSATLATNKKFNFTRRQLGLVPELIHDRNVIENIYESPFDYNQQALFAVPTDIPDPLQPGFIQAAAEKIWQSIQISHGNAFVLFTSYSMLKSCHDLLAQRLNANRYVTLKQGDDNRQSLLQRFKTTNRSVLFGTDSFWEGVDVVGEALRCVIIVKLPFKVPTEPIIQARTEAISANGGDPFSDYSLPHAIVKFKQGFGRLIRNKRDRGCIVCLDTRLIKKSYGQQFLNSLPNCQQIFAESELVKQHMTEFYRKTHHLTKAPQKL